MLNDVQFKNAKAGDSTDATDPQFRLWPGAGVETRHYDNSRGESGLPGKRVICIAGMDVRQSRPAHPRQPYVTVSSGSPFTSMHLRLKLDAIDHRKIRYERHRQLKRRFAVD
jgi:hypothetical protein